LLRITEQRRSGSTTLKLEGKLTGAWVGELERAWQSAGDPKGIIIDLCNVSFVNTRGRDLLARMYRGGADLVTSTPLMKQVVEEITNGPER
jgi:anti-anti-sigma regulatory factor